MASPLLGRVLSERFRIAAFLGEGAMANVYRGLDLKAIGAPAEVAIKVMHPALKVDPTFLQRFRREAQAASRLTHPNTVRIIEYGVDKELVYMAMELLAGADLFEVLVAEGRLSEVKAVRISLQICDALTAAHAEGIVHRDLKPENIMVLRDPKRPDVLNVKVLDFGIAKIMDREDGAPDSWAPDSARSGFPAGQITTVGVVVGTPAYMSPEQCRGDAIDPRSDVYACGVLLYQLLTGRVPFGGATPVEIAMQQILATPPPPSQFVPGLNSALERVIMKALAKPPEQRQQSAADLKSELANVLAKLPGVLPATPTRRVSAPGWTRGVLALGSPRPPLAHAENVDVGQPTPSAIREIVRVTAQPVIVTGPPAMANDTDDADTVADAEPLATPAVRERIAPAPVVQEIVVADAAAVDVALPIASISPPESRLSAAARPWILVPLAIVVGVAAGAIAYWLAH